MNNIQTQVSRLESLHNDIALAEESLKQLKSKKKEHRSSIAVAIQNHLEYLTVKEAKEWIDNFYWNNEELKSNVSEAYRKTFGNKFVPLPKKMEVRCNKCHKLESKSCATWHEYKVRASKEGSYRKHTCESCQLIIKKQKQNQKQDKTDHSGFACPQNNQESFENKESTYGDTAADKLYQALAKNKKIMRRDTNLRAWSSTVDGFIQDTICTIEEFDGVLNWYVVHMFEKFVPQACSAKSFCEKFVRISDAMTRDAHKEQNENKTNDDDWGDDDTDDWDEDEEYQIEQLKSMPYQQYLQTDHWQSIRKRELKYADYRCRLCDEDVNLQVHHRTYDRIGCERPNDVTALCQECHEKHHDIEKDE